MGDERYPSYGSADLARYAESRYAEHDGEKSGWANKDVAWLLDQARINSQQAMQAGKSTDALRSMADAHCYLSMAWEVHEGIADEAVPERTQENGR